MKPNKIDKKKNKKRIESCELGELFFFSEWIWNNRELGLNF